MTDKEIDKLMQNPRVRRFVESGDKERAERLTSMSYMLISVGNEYQEEVNDLLHKYGLMITDLKYFTNRLTAAFDQYNTVVKSMIPDMEAKKELIKEYGILSEFAEMVIKGNVTVKRGDYFGATLYLPKKD